MLGKIYRIYCKIEEVIVGAGFATIVGLTLLNAFLRLFKHPIVTADDISLLLFGWVAFMGADVAMRYSRLVGMDILVSKFPAKLQKIFQVIVYAIMIAALCIFIRHGFALAAGNWKRHFNSLSISYGWVSLSLPVCSCLMVFTCLVKIIKVVTHYKDDSYNVRKDNPDLVGEEYTGIEGPPEASASDVI